MEYELYRKAHIIQSDIEGLKRTLSILETLRKIGRLNLVDEASENGVAVPQGEITERICNMIKLYIAECIEEKQKQFDKL